MILWQPTTTGVVTWFSGDCGAQTFRTTTSRCPQRPSVVSITALDLDTSEVLADSIVNPSGQQVYYALILGGPRDIRTTLHYLARPVAPRELSSEEMQCIYVSSVPLSQLRAEIFGPRQWINILCLVRAVNFTWWCCGSTRKSWWCVTATATASSRPSS